MKSLLSVFLLVVLSVSAMAQVGYGPEIGIGLSTLKFAPPTAPINYTAASVSSIFSGKIGGAADIPLNSHFYFQSGLALSLKGAKKDFSYYHNDSFNESVQQTLQLYYVELPLNVVYKTSSQGKGRFFFGIGANPSYVIGGKNHLQDNGKYNDTSISGAGTYAVVAGKTVHGFDIGVNFLAGYELPVGLYFKAYYLTGVNDIGIGTETEKNRLYGIAAGYFFGKGRNINKEASDLIDKGN